MTSSVTISFSKSLLIQKNWWNSFDADYDLDIYVVFLRTG